MRMYYVLHPCSAPQCKVMILHTPAYRDHWQQVHAAQYSLADIDRDTSKQPLAVKIRDKFQLPLRLPETKEPENFHKSAYISWNAVIRVRTPMEELRLQNSIDATYPACLIRIDITPDHDPQSDIGSLLGAETVAEWDTRLHQLLCVKLKITIEAIRYLCTRGNSLQQGYTTGNS